MNHDHSNFNSDDLQNTMELPVTGGKKEPVREIYDPWNLGGNRLPQSVLDAIAKSLENSDKMPETLTVSLDPEKEKKAEKQNIEEKPVEKPAEVLEEPPEEISSEDAVKEEVSAPEADKTQKMEKEEPAEKNVSAGDTMVVPVVKKDPKPPKEDPEKDSLPIKEEPEKEMVRQEAKPGRIWPPVLASSLILIVACCITLFAAILPVLSELGFLRGMTQIIVPVINSDKPPAQTNIMLLGVDKGGYRTDTMMVATYDVEKNNVSIMQLPRDTYVENNGRRDKKLNSAYYSGVDQLKREIKLAYGIEVHKHVAINLEAFKKMIDAIGGVKTVIPFNMIYDDPVQDFHVYLIAQKDENGNPIPQLLDGDKAEQFVRFRKNNDGSGYARGDLERMEVQRQFILDAVGQMVSVNGLMNINELIKIAQENVDTDMTFKEIYDYCTAILGVKEGAIEFVDAPGYGKTFPYGSYFIVDYEGAKQIAMERFYATPETLSKMQRTAVRADAPAATSPEDSQESSVGEGSSVAEPEDAEPVDPEVDAPAETPDETDQPITEEPEPETEPQPVPEPETEAEPPVDSSNSDN